MSDFDTRDLGDLIAVGATDATGVRLWVRTIRPGPHDVEIWTDRERHAGVVDLRPPPGADGTISVRYPDDIPGAAPLTPITAYRCRVRRGREVVGEGQFETAPRGVDDAPTRFSFAVMSCHQPFDQHGMLDPASLRMLRALDPALREHNVKRVFLMGDQMYADYPERLSLFDPDYFARVAPAGRRDVLACSQEEIRALYQRRYRAFWSVEPFGALLARYPCYPILDDHELRDNFGSAPAHAGAAWMAVRNGGLDAFHDYQGLLHGGRGFGRPTTFDFEVRYADVGVYGLDVRSQRVADATTLRVCSDAQLDALAGFLARSGDLQVVMLVVSVPLVVFPGWVTAVATQLLGEASDAADRWNHPKAARSQARLADLLCEHQRRHPQQRVILLAGDIHAGCAVQFVWRDPDVRPVYQLVSSAVSNLADAIARRAAGIAPRLEQALDGSAADRWARTELLPGRGGAAENPFHELNIGIVELTRGPAGRVDVVLELLGHDDGDPPAPRLVYESLPL